MSMLALHPPALPPALYMPLLSDYQNPNIEDQAIKQANESQKQIDDLEKRACCRNRRKNSRFWLSFCSTLGACCSEVVPCILCERPAHEEDVSSGIAVSNWTNCDGSAGNRNACPRIKLSCFARSL